jgi:hypothetical protein
MAAPVQEIMDRELQLQTIYLLLNKYLKYIAKTMLHFLIPVKIIRLVTYNDKHRGPGEDADLINRYNNYRTRVRIRRWLGSLTV